MFQQVNKKEIVERSGVANNVAQNKNSDTIFQFVDNRPENVLQSNFREKTTQLKIQSEQPVVQLANEWGLNDYKQIHAFNDNLYENLPRSNDVPNMSKISAMMLSINKNLTSLNLPEMKVVEAKDLENTGSANFDFKTWKMQIDPEKLNEIDAGLANTLYHEARHSEQWFKMIAKRLMEGQKKEQIVSTMGVPEEIVQKAIEIGPENILPVEQKEAVTSFYESVYGKGSAHRTKVLLNLNKDGNYEAYKKLPEEVDAWEVGGNVEEIMDVDLISLKGKIMDTNDLNEIRNYLSKVEFLSEMLPKPTFTVESILKEKLNTWNNKLKEIEATSVEDNVHKFGDYITLVDKYNNLATRAKVPNFSSDFELEYRIMSKNLEEAEKLDEQNPNIWAVGKLIGYIKDCMIQYEDETSKPQPSVSTLFWCLSTTGEFVKQIKQAIVEEKEQELDSDSKD
ncbi:hypothetical protein [Tenacibaculum agarivorans]|uniref:hypothetical protein n=1 Tax=Tenacibaculum agarivorans TaxID=1908389 RepID=UPI00094B94ED|nr:hypothetical protein [Tenacibaculum agarivorans]